MDRDADFQIQRDRAVAFMNAGHSLLLRDLRADAIIAYTNAIELLRPLPLSRQPSWANSLGAALMNRGYLIHRAHGLSRTSDALADFSGAIAILEAVPRAGSPWAHRNLAGALLNRANLLLDLNHHAEARADAARSLTLVEPESASESIDAELALKASRVICDAIGRALPVLPAAEQGAMADEAGETVDNALALIRRWSLGGNDAFAPLALRLFRFGCELYRRHQPQFLAEFVCENIDAAFACAGELREVARESLDAALADADAPAIFRIGDLSALRTIRTHRSLTAARAGLEARGTFS